LEEPSKEAKRIIVHFDEVADRILEKTHIFTMRDTGEIYLYSDGVYENEGAKAFLDSDIRVTQQFIFFDKWYEKNEGIPFPEHIPKATKHFVSEALAYIQSRTYISRERIEAENAKYLNFDNCLFNLETWETEEHTPEIKSISQIPVEYNPEAKCPTIANFLNDVAKPEDIPFLLEWTGYCLTPWVMHQKSLMVYGIPGTGKSVFLALLEALVGEKNCSAESLQKLEEDKYRCANLYGKRVNICSDIPSTRMHKTEMFKRLTSGIDTIDAEKKYMPSFNFKNTAKLTFSANKLPPGPKDPAFYERFCLIEFSNKFRGTAKDDKRLIRKLIGAGELSGFLNLALEGLKRLKDTDCFSYSKSFEEVEKEYLLNSNPVSFFMEKYTVVSPDDIDSTVLFGNFIQWCILQNLPIMVKSVFGKALSNLGYETYRDNVPGGSGKKATFILNVAVKKDELEQATVKSGQANVQAEKICLSYGPDSEKLGFGQEKNSFVKNYSQQKNQQCKERYTEVFEGKPLLERLEGKNDHNIREDENNKKQSKISLSNLGFFDTGTYGQDGSKLPVHLPVQFQKFTDFEPEQSKEFITKLNSLKNEIKTFHSTWLRKNGGVDDTSAFCGTFIKAYPGFLQTFPEGVIISEIEKVCKRIPSEHTNVSDQEDSGEVESAVEG
jgi:putative DNA primase/helicase